MTAYVGGRKFWKFLRKYLFFLLCHVRQDCSIIWYSKSHGLFKKNPSVAGSLQIYDARLLLKTMKGGAGHSHEGDTVLIPQDLSLPLDETSASNSMVLPGPPSHWKCFSFIRPNGMNKTFCLIFTMAVVVLRDSKWKLFCLFNSLLMTT